VLKRNKIKWLYLEIVVMQQATPSEILIFQKLANPSRVNRLPKDPVKKPEEVFKHAVQDEIRRGSSSHGDDDNRRKESEVREDRDYREHSKDRGKGHGKDHDKEQSRDYKEQSRDYKEQSREHRDEDEKSDKHERPAEREMSDEEAAAEHEREKLGMIDFINKKAMRGVRTTKNYTRDDPFDEIQFEYERIKTNEETNGAVNLMREGLRFMCQGVEMGNEKFGPILSLNRWVETKLAPETMSRFDPVLEKLYKKHWRKGSMAPELELLMLVGGSMAMHHFETVRGGGSGKDAPAPFARQHSAGPTTPFNLIGAMMGGGGGVRPPPMQQHMHPQMQQHMHPQMQQHMHPQMQQHMQQTTPPPPPSGRPVMRGPVDTPRQTQMPVDELMQAQDAQMRALQQRAMMLAAKQRDLDAAEARMDRRMEPPRPMFVISSMQKPKQPTVEVIASEDERSVALSDGHESESSTRHASDAQSDAQSEVGSQASSATRRRKNYTSRRKNKLRV